MENYTDAALRHWKDAGLLEKENSVENADHHYGFAAECAIKKVLAIHPHLANESGPSAIPRKHINVLWGKIALQSIQKMAPTLPTLLKGPNLFSDWSVDQRYASNGTVTLAAMHLHKQAARRLLGATGLTGYRRS